MGGNATSVEPQLEFRDGINGTKDGMVVCRRERNARRPRSDVPESCNIDLNRHAPIRVLKSHEELELFAAGPGLNVDVAHPTS